MNIIKLFFISLLLASTLAFSATPAYAEDSADAAETEKDGSLTCNQKFLQEKYFGETAEDAQDKCWYCRIVIIMTNAYLQAASQALPVAQQLGQLVVKLGFGIWLALFIVKQISTIGGVTPGKMLQEILVMGFKCAFSYYAIAEGIGFITQFILNPILITGTDIGNAIFNKI